MPDTHPKLQFTSDYMEGAHPSILEALVQTNLQKTEGYGFDPFCDAAKEKLRHACRCPDAEIYFLVGGTQTNATVIDALLRGYQGVLCAETGHIATHEAGAIEFGGHKALTLPHTLGKLSAETIAHAMDVYNGDANREHTVMPGMVYLSHPTEYGTLYSLEELTAIRQVCRKNGLPLYLDGARLAYGLSSPENDVTLPALSQLCDAFYIGGTKCGALLGEAVVIPKPGLIPHFFTTIKQHGALLAKGRLLGIQFDRLFTDDLYLHIGDSAVKYAQLLQQALMEKGYPLLFRSPTNQIFPILSREAYDRLSGICSFGFWEQLEDGRTAVRFATSWATTEADIRALIAAL